jgi:hypothetical protein
MALPTPHPVLPPRDNHTRQQQAGGRAACTVSAVGSTSRPPGPATRSMASGLVGSTGHAPRAPTPNLVPPLRVDRRRYPSRQWRYSTCSQRHPVPPCGRGSPRQWCPTILSYHEGRRLAPRPTAALLIRHSEDLTALNRRDCFRADNVVQQEGDALRDGNKSLYLVFVGVVFLSILDCF